MAAMSAPAQRRNNRSTSARSTGGSGLDPFEWWRRLCFVTPQLVLSGDLPWRSGDADQHLQQWVDAGITDIVDVRGESSDQELVARLAPQVRYHWFGTHDDGGSQPDTWFDNGVKAATTALADPSAMVMVHCHMGVNRGPSMGFAVMVAMGVDPVEALDAIRAARPIAAVIYADQAVDWWHRRQGSPAGKASADERRVRQWHRDNPVDVDWIVSRIDNRGR